VKPVTIHAEAEAEALAAIEYYESRRDELGREFRQELEAAISRIRGMPESFVVIDNRGTRKHKLHRPSIMSTWRIPSGSSPSPTRSDIPVTGPDEVPRATRAHKPPSTGWKTNQLHRSPFLKFMDIMAARR
jgi:hypothetical protein